MTRFVQGRATGQTRLTQGRAPSPTRLVQGRVDPISGTSGTIGQPIGLLLTLTRAV